MDLGTVTVHEELEQCIASFIGKEAAMIYAMGYGTNGSTIPALMGSECLIISDSLNHTSIVNGARASASMIRVFQHNKPALLEELLLEAIVEGKVTSSSSSSNVDNIHILYIYDMSMYESSSDL